MGTADRKPGLTPEAPATSGDVPAPNGQETEIPAGEPEAPVGPAVEDPDTEQTQGPEPETPDEPDRDHEARLEHDLEELTAKAQKADEYLELAQRTRADFENYRKRAARETAAAQERGLVRPARVLVDGWAGRWQRDPTTTRSWALARTPRTRRSRRRTGGWRANTTRTATRATSRLRSDSRRSPRRTTCCRIPRSARRTTAAQRRLGSAPRAGSIRERSPAASATSSRICSA